MLFKKALTPHELLKPIRKGPNAGSGLSRCEVLLQKIEAGEPLRLVGSEDSVAIERLTDEQRSSILSGDRSRLLGVRLHGQGGGEYRLSDFAKTEEFGSSRTELPGEHIQSVILDSAIKLRGRVDIRLGPFLFPGVVGARQVKERINGKLPKADVALFDDHGDVAWLSLKSVRSGSPNPNDTQQYSGITFQSGIHVAEHEETKDFVEYVKKVYPNGVPERQSITRDIHSEALKIHAMFGEDSLYTDFGPNKCHAVLHGTPALYGRDLRASGRLFLFGEVPTDGYAPAFIACYRADRSTCGIPKTRIMIYPRDGRKINEVV